MAVAPDGRRCVRPEHGSEHRHMVCSPLLSVDSARRVAEAWGWHARMADSIVRRESRGGWVAAEAFVLAVSANPLRAWLS